MLRVTAPAQAAAHSKKKRGKKMDSSFEKLLDKIPSEFSDEWSVLTDVSFGGESTGAAHEWKVWLPTKAFVECNFATGDPVFLLGEDEEERESKWTVVTAWPEDRLKKGQGVIAKALVERFQGARQVRFVPLKALLILGMKQNPPLR